MDDRHVVQRMRQRRISVAQVERTIEAPTRSYPSTNPPGRVIAERMTGAGNTPRVVYVEQATCGGTVAYVITAIRIGGRRTI